jgi:hypothetical protein
MKKQLNNRKYGQNNGGKLIGGGIDRWFVKHLRSSRDLFHEVLGWAIDVNNLEGLDQEGVQKIWVIDFDTDIIYQATLSDFAEYGLPVHGSQERQICLPIQYWSISRGELP